MDQGDCLWNEHPSSNADPDLGVRPAPRHSGAFHNTDERYAEGHDIVGVDEAGHGPQHSESGQQYGGDPADMSLCTIDVADRSFIDVPTTVASGRRIGGRSSTPDGGTEMRGYAMFEGERVERQTNNGVGYSQTSRVQGTEAIFQSRQQTVYDGRNSTTRHATRDGGGEPAVPTTFSFQRSAVPPRVGAQRSHTNADENPCSHTGGVRGD